MAALASSVRSEGSGQRRRWSFTFAAAVALALAVGVVRDRWADAEPALDPATLVAGHGPANFAAALARANGEVAAARRRQAAGGQWLIREGLATALVNHHRLTGDYADLSEAQRQLDQGLAEAPDPSGPVLSQANFNLIVHRLPEAQAMLARFDRWAIRSPMERADALALAGDIAQQRGDIAGALARYGQAEALAPSLGIEVRTAMLLARTGEREEARQRLERLLARPEQAPGALAELALQRAQLAYAQGDWSAASEWTDAANRLFPGYWLAEAYAAQNLAVAGRREEAIRRLSLVAEKSGSPEAMDALAHLLRLEGRRDDSLTWWRRADALWRARLERFPEAASLHAAEHALIGGEPARALTLAQAEAARRPNGMTLGVLARALLVNGEPRQALAALDRAERQGWVSAGLLMLRSEAAAALGDEQASDDARSRAEAINPNAASPQTRLIWFGHD